jgi:transcription elongation factor Elf1
MNEPTITPELLDNRLNLKFDYECLHCAKMNKFEIGTDRPVYHELIHCEHCGKPMMLEYRTVVQAKIYKVDEKAGDFFVQGKIIDDMDDPTGKESP